MTRLFDHTNHFFSDIFFSLKVEEVKGVITVSGVKHAGIMISQIERLMNTTRVGKYLLLNSGSSKFSFYSYHALDVIYLLNKLIRDRKTSYVPDKTIRSIIKGIEENTWVARTFKTYPSMFDRKRLHDFNVTPLPHQEDFFAFYDSIVQKHMLKGLMTAASAGTGKTLMSLFIQRMLPVDICIIVCPLPTLLDVWVDSTTRFFNTQPVVWHSRLSTPIPKDVEYIIIHYEYLSNFMSKHKLPSNKRYGVILDESHNFTGPSNRTTAFIHMCSALNSRHTLWLSGTPIKASAIEAMPLIRTIDPLFTPRVEARAKKAFAGNNKEMNEMLGSRLQLYMRKVEKSVLGLPPPIERTIKVKLPNAKSYTLTAVSEEIKEFVVERSKYYQSMEAENKRKFLEVLAWFEKTLKSKSEIDRYKAYRVDLAIVVSMKGFIMEIGHIVSAVNAYELKTIIPALPSNLKQQFKDTRALYKYPMLKVIGEALGQVLGKRRNECFTAIAKAIDYASIIEQTTTKTLVFASNIDAVIAAGNKCKEQGLSPVIVYGGGSTSIPQAMDLINKDAEKDPLVATYMSLSTGVPIIACSATVFCNRPFRPHILNQAIARTWRLGQTEQVYLYFAELNTGDETNLSSRNADIMKMAGDAVKQITGIDYVPADTSMDTEAQGLKPTKHNVVDRVLADEIPDIEQMFAS